MLSRHGLIQSEHQGNKALRAKESEERKTEAETEERGNSARAEGRPRWRTARGSCGYHGATLRVIRAE